MTKPKFNSALHGLAVAAAGIFFVYFVSFLMTSWDSAIFSWRYWGVGDSSGATKSEIVRNLGLLAAAIVGLFFGMWRAYTAHRQAEASERQAEAANQLATAAIEQARIAEQGQITDRYTKAVEMLADEKASTRMGAVYALARIAQDSIDRDHIPVMEVLAGFIRNSPYLEEANMRRQAWQNALQATDYEHDIPPAIPCPDVLTALKVIVKRNDAQKARENSANFTLMLSRAELSEHDLANAEFNDLFLTGANFKNAALLGADFSGARLRLANIRGADLYIAKFIGADLSDAILTDVKNLQQSQIDRCKPSAPPHDLPNELEWPFVEEDGEWVKRE